MKAIRKIAMKLCVDPPERVSHATVEEIHYPDGDPHLVYEVARDYLTAQLSFVDALDAKLGVFFTGASGLLGVAAAILALAPPASRAAGGAALVGCVGIYL